MQTCCLLLSVADRAAAMTEAARLQRLHTKLSANSVEDAAQQLKPAATDADGLVLQQLLQWRQLRILAIQQEVARLAKDWGMTPAELAAAVDQAAESASANEDPMQLDPNHSGGIQGAAGEVWSELIQWLRNFGAVVRLRAK